MKSSCLGGEPNGNQNIFFRHKYNQESNPCGTQSNKLLIV